MYTIDLSDAFTERRPLIVQQISVAAHTCGFFQVENHGIPLDVMENTLLLARLFHEQHLEYKSEFIYTSPILHLGQVGARDSLHMPLEPVLPAPGLVPNFCIRQFLEWDVEVLRVAKLVMELLSEGLGLESGRIEDMACHRGRYMDADYFPYGSQGAILNLDFPPGSNLAVGPFTDPCVMKIQVQDKPNGLQFKDGDVWLEFPAWDDLLVSVGDLLQIFSNDNYKRAVQRVVADDMMEPPVSLSIFFYPAGGGNLGPFRELLSNNEPPHYRRFTLPQFFDQAHYTDPLSSFRFRD
ncbi:1-aminocyclopropane-1-carboxylate oxidase 1-like protein [Cinnamomum micranthum f. kanehirae]|uniref:1-aminocyclopropane-1-carboxylate oxidase 1-like protein n=1 Tax=Cinnamomum micranthum f. kanehirae TaxID=337451 RepID=A0A443N214_9MAGN|nr:1-aminocyclopropane-1-carboxylate oxidase 1-like protein [Cinnamomum micranthum f. kanehirae]